MAAGRELTASATQRSAALHSRARGLMPGGVSSPVRAFRGVVDRLRESPGVVGAAVTSQAPLGAGGNSNGLIPEGKSFGRSDTKLEEMNYLVEGVIGE